jgi:hypothetical protein
MAEKGGKGSIDKGKVVKLKGSFQSRASTVIGGMQLKVLKAKL